MVRGDPATSLSEGGLFLSTMLAWFSRKSAHVRTDKLNFIANVCQRGELFDFPTSV